MIYPPQLGEIVFWSNRASDQMNKMYKNELIERISDIEWEDFEVKEAASEIPKSCWETVSAFANTIGGWLFLGIKQTGNIFQITGVKNPEKLAQDFLNTLRGEKFNAKIATRQLAINLEDKKVLGFYIEPSPHKPIYFNTQANTFIRRGSSDHRASKQEIDSMYRDQSFGTKTSQIVSGSKSGDLHLNSINQYRDYMARFNPTVSYNRYEMNEFLDKLRVTENGALTYGGLLMFGKREAIEKHFPDFRIDLLVIPGTSYSDAKMRYTYRLDEHENIWEYYFECFSRLKQKVDVNFTLTTEGFGQELSPGLEAIREALVNMLMHADYFSPAHSRIRIFNDHIEFFNPGGLPKPLEELKAKDISMPRNPIITKLFRMVKLAENAGFGLDKIESNWLKYNQSQPLFTIDFDNTILLLKVEETGKDIHEDADFRHVNLQVWGERWGEKWGERWGEKWPEISEWWRKEHNKSLSANEVKILDLIAIKPEISIVKISETIGIVETAVENNLKKLKLKQIIQRVGPAKGGHWEIISRKPTK